jgi:hypothetical protein
VTGLNPSGFKQVGLRCFFWGKAVFKPGPNPRGFGQPVGCPAQLASHYGYQFRMSIPNFQKLHPTTDLSA